MRQVPACRDQDGGREAGGVGEEVEGHRGRLYQGRGEVHPDVGERRACACVGIIVPVYVFATCGVFFCFFCFGDACLVGDVAHIQLAPCIVEISSRNRVVLPRRPFVAQILTRVSAACVARRDGADSGGPTAPGPRWGSDLETWLESATDGVAKRDLKRSQIAS